MSTAFAVFLSGIVLAGVYLYGITKDRWNWRRLGAWITLVLGTMGAIVVTFVVNTFFDVKVARYVGAVLGCVLSYFAIHLAGSKRTENTPLFRRLKIISLLILGLILLIPCGQIAYVTTKKAIAAHETAKSLTREAKARSCNAGEIRRIEPLLQKSRDSLTAGNTFEGARAALSALLGSSGELSIPEENIGLREITYTVKTNCDSLFAYVVSLRATDTGTLLSLTTRVVNPPVGYPPEKSVFDLGTSSAFSGWKDSPEQMVLLRYSVDYLNARQVGRNLLASSDPPLSATNGANRQSSDSSEPSPGPWEYYARNRAPAPSSGHKGHFVPDGAENDPCAPGLSREERLKRLRTYGQVRETSTDTYEAGTHQITFGTYVPLIHCE
jgi:hypothetical protein